MPGAGAGFQGSVSVRLRHWPESHLMAANPMPAKSHGRLPPLVLVHGLLGPRHALFTAAWTPGPLSATRY